MTVADWNRMPRLRTCILIDSERAPGLKVRTKEGHQIEAATLGEAIAVAEELLGVKIVADPQSAYGSKLFRLCSPNKANSGPLGIILHRGDTQLSSVNDLSLPLLETDVVGISALAG